jgi:hypothetical protein
VNLPGESVLHLAPDKAAILLDTPLGLGLEVRFPSIKSEKVVRNQVGREGPMRLSRRSEAMGSLPLNEATIAGKQDPQHPLTDPISAPSNLLT